MDREEEVNLAREHSRQRPFLQFASMFAPQLVIGCDKIRVGSPSDGGYVMLNDFSGVDLALSFGVELNADWDIDIAERGINVRQFDHSVPFSPADHPRVQFFKKMIVPKGESDETASIESIISDARVCKNASVLLKMDIEDAEWDVLDACSVEHLGLFSQIVIEFHNIDRAADPYWLMRAHRVLRKLRSHFGVFHVHANNWSGMAVIGNVYFPLTLEVSVGNLTRYSFAATNELFPTPLDRPNNPLRPDLYLGAFRYDVIA